MKKIIFSASIFLVCLSANAQISASGTQTITLDLHNSINIIIGFGLDNNLVLPTANYIQNVSANTSGLPLILKSMHPWTLTVKSVPVSFSPYALINKPDFNYVAGIYTISVVYTASPK